MFSMLLPVEMKSGGGIMHEVLVLWFRKMMDIYSKLLSEMSQRGLYQCC